MRVAHGGAELGDCEVVIEAVVEDLEVKADTLAVLVPALPPNAIIASNTSSLSITRIGGEVRIRDASRIMRAAPNEPAAFNVSLPSLRLDAPGVFAEPIAFSNVEVVGAIVSAERSIRFTQLRAQTGEATLQGAGRIYWGEAGTGENRGTHAGVELTGRIDGSLDARDLLVVEVAETSGQPRRPASSHAPCHPGAGGSEPEDDAPPVLVRPHAFDQSARLEAVDVT